MIMVVLPLVRARVGIVGGACHLPVICKKTARAPQAIRDTDVKPRHCSGRLAGCGEGARRGKFCRPLRPRFARRQGDAMSCRKPRFDMEMAVALASAYRPRHRSR